MKIARDEGIFSDHFHIGYVRKVNVFCTITLDLSFDGDKPPLTILQNVPIFQNQSPGWTETSLSMCVNKYVNVLWSFKENHRTNCPGIQRNVIMAAYGKIKCEMSLITISVIYFLCCYKGNISQRLLSTSRICRRNLSSLNSLVACRCDPIVRRRPELLTDYNVHSKNDSLTN